MRERRIDLNITDDSVSRFDDVIEWLLISLLAFMPLAFGAVHAWSEEIVVALAAAISICFLLKLVYEKDLRIIPCISTANTVVMISKSVKKRNKIDELKPISIHNGLSKSQPPIL